MLKQKPTLFSYRNTIRWYVRIEQYIDHHQPKKLVMVNLHILWCNGRAAMYRYTQNAPENYGKPMFTIRCQFCNSEINV